MSNDGSTYAPSVRTEDDDDVATRDHMGTFEPKRNSAMPIDDQVKVIVGRKVYKLGQVIGVSDDGTHADTKAKNTKKIIAKLFKFAGLLTTDGKVASNRALAACLNLRKMPRQYADDATTWAPEAQYSARREGYRCHPRALGCAVVGAPGSCLGPLECQARPHTS
jgi:hypothetical protein